MTVHEQVDLPVTATGLSDRQRRIVRRAAYPALVTAILGPTAVFFFSGRTSVPPDNLNGHVYLDYALAHRTGEVQSLLFILTVLAMAGFLTALGVVYAQRSGRLTYPAVTMIGSAVAFASLQLIAATCNLTIALLGNGYPSFRTDPAAPLITTMLWDLTNVVVTVGYLPFVIAIFAVVAANRTHPILPRWLAGRTAVVVAGFVGIALIATLFVGTGDFTPMSSAAGVITAAPLSLWLAAVGVAALWRTRSNSVTGKST
jgi:hypothetical protein